MNKQELLEDIKEGRPVDAGMIPGWINTPVMPEEVFDIEYNSKGEEFKRSINAGKWINWINEVAEATVDPEADMESKSIAGTHFHSQCDSAYSSVMRNLEENKGYTGAVWIENGNPYSIALEGANIITAKVALQKVLANTIKPKDRANVSDKFSKDNERTITDIVHGGR